MNRSSTSFVMHNRTIQGSITQGAQVFRWMTRTNVSVPPPRDRDAQARARGARLFTEAREELNRADTKAQVLLGVAGLGIGAIAGGLLAGNWSPMKLHVGLQWLWWVGAVCALAALVCLAGAVYPRITKRALGFTYFGDVNRYGSAVKIANALRKHDDEDLTALAEQIRTISVIVTRKYRLIRWGFWLLLISIGSTVGSAVIQLVL
ncbi:Pycsar system effector family protein [Streptosporangium longisporum]|uniref:Pycsar effector protein domain-containing protein n=1 Tax=Streptosporangium longisporum TaxID=46187 RepID=A0ABN3XXK8_9ACTN